MVAAAWLPAAARRRIRPGRKLLLSLAGALGLVALRRALRRRREAPRPAVETPAPAAEPAAATAEDDPAEALRRTIAAARGGEEPAEADEPSPPASIEERRRRVHERAQEAIDAMRDEPPPAG